MENTETSIIERLKSRYSDAYIVARVTNGIGQTIKDVGKFGAFLIIAVAVVVAVVFLRDSGFMFMLVIAIGSAYALLFGLILYVFGILIAAQGQILKASLDSSVNNSPFLTNEHRVEIMSLATKSVVPTPVTDEPGYRNPIDY